MAGKKKEKSGGGNRKKGRCFRPGQANNRARARARRIERKIRNVKRSNGLEFYAEWSVTRLPELRAYAPMAVKTKQK